MSSAWLIAPSDILFTALDTSFDEEEADCAVAVSSSAVAAVFCACEEMLLTIAERFSVIVFIDLITLAISSLPFMYFVAWAVSSDISRS